MIIIGPGTTEFDIEESGRVPLDVNQSNEVNMEVRDSGNTEFSQKSYFVRYETGTNDYEELDKKPKINGVTLIRNLSSADLGLASEADLSDAVASLRLEMPKIYYDTTAGWSAQTTLMSEENALYIYTDYQTEGNDTLAGIKVGDGLAYVVDLPFIDKLIQMHMADTDIHITAAEREFWNNKVRAYYSLTQSDTLVLTTQ